MRPTIPLLLLGPLACAAPPIDPEQPVETTYRSYETPDRKNLQSTLVEQRGQHQTTLRGRTQLQDGTWLMEQATLDRSGHLVRAEIDRGGPCQEHPTHITLDPQNGRIEINTAGIYTRWSVPNDVPWVPVGLIAAENAGHNLATPVAMTIALRSAKTERATRLVDIQHFTSATIMSDQVLVDDDEPTVVLGDDYADIQGDLPLRLHLAAYDGDLDAHDPDLTGAWARLRCQTSCEDTAL